MKRLVLFVLVLLSTTLSRADVALVYTSTSSVSKTLFSPGVATTEGVAVNSQGILAAADQLLAGLQGQELRKASLVRFDNDLNLALIRLGERVPDEDLQASHKKNSEKMSLFLPELGQVPVVQVQASSDSAVVPVSGEKFLLQINDQSAGSQPIVISKWRRKADVLIKIVGNNIEPVWRVVVELQAEPDLRFWKKGDERGLNAIPSRTLNYAYQVMLKPYGKNDVLKIPVEISSIKEENYQFKFKIDSKAGVYEVTVPVRFEEKK
jgi:hypothetical protein